MDALLVCAEEIALDGLDGCPIIHLWNNLENASPPFPLKLDDAAKSYLWKGIVEALDVSFYLLDQPLPRIFSNSKEKNLKKYLGGCKNFDVNSIDLAVNPYSLVNDGKIRGSCPEYNTRKDITAEIRNSGRCLVMLEEAQERWGDKLVMVASQDMRNKALVTEEVDPNVSLTDIEYCILEHVGQARTKGRLQRCINMFLKIDARTTFHFLKKMKVLGLVTKQRFVTQSEPSKNIWSNIIRLKKFPSACYHKYDILGHQICQKLQEQPDNTMALKDLREYFEETGAKERIIKRVRQDLQTSGHIELVLKRVPSCAKSNVNRANKGQLRHYVKLIKPFPLWTGNEDNEEHDEDDEDNDDDDDGVQICDGQPNVVMELSLLKQMYDFIEHKAEHGASNKEIANGIKLSQYVHRALVKTLEKSGHIKPVLTYGGRQTFLRYVATPFVEESYHMSKILEEKKKLDAVKGLAGTSSPPVGTPVETRVDSPCPSPGLSTQANETLDIESKDTTAEKKKPKSKSALAGKVTYRKLKRNNFIIEFLKTQKIVKGYQPILKAIQEAEEKEGLENKMDRVFLKRSLERLNEDGLIKKMTTVMEINNSSHSIDFYLHPSINSQDPAVQVALDQCRFQLYGDANKSKASSKKKSKKDGNKTTDDDEDKDEDEDEDEDLDPDKIISDHSIRYNYGYLAKFPRMRLLHEYLWQVIFGLKQRKQEARNVNNPEQSGITHCDNPPTVESELKTSGNMDSGPVDSGSKDPESGKTTAVGGAELKKESQSTGEFDSKTHDYDWINYLESFPLYDMPMGWFKLVDATSIMPLSVFCNILGIVTEVDGLDEYYNDPKLRHTLLKDLPKKMQRRLKHKARYKQSLCGIVSNLMCAGLLAPKLPVPVERLMTEIHFSKGAIITNTTTSLPNYDKTQEPAGQKFTSNKFVFNTFSDVQAYWDEVMCVALNTPLGFIRTPNNSRERKWFKFSHCKTPVMLEDSIVPPPGDGKGACGFDSYLHAHLSRNWSFCKSGNPKYGVPTSEKRDVKLKNGEPPTKKHKKSHKEPSKKPKPTVPKKADKPKPKPKAKRPSFEKMIIRPPKKPRYIETPNIRTPCFSDKEKQKQTHNAGKHLISVDDVDREALAKVTGLRKNYSPETDKTLILCRIGLEIMKKTSYRNPYPFPDIRDIVHEYCEDGANKTAPNCQSRLLRLMKNPKNVATINICVAEYSLYEEFMGLDNPDLPFSETFHSLMTRLIELSRTRVACLEDTSQLSSSLEELYQRFYVQRLSLPDDALSPFADTSVLGPPIQIVKDIRLSVVRDVIQISSHSEQARYNSLGVFKMFDDFKMDEKDEAYAELLKTGLLIRKREYTAAFRRTIPFAPISCQLSYIYNKHFQPKGIQPSTFDEAILFLKQLNDSSKNPSQQGRPMPIRLLEDKIVGGDVASILSLLTINKLTVEFHVPDQLVQKDEKQQDNLRTKKKSKLTSELPSLIGPKQKKQRKDVKKVEFAEGREAKKSKAKTKRKKTAAKRMSENERTDSEGDTANSTSTLEDDSKADEANTKHTTMKGMPESEGINIGGSSGENKSAFKNDLTRDDAETAKLNKIEVSGNKKNDNGEHGGNGKSAVNSLPTTEDGFVKPKGLPKEKAKRKDTAKESMLVGEEGQGTNEITSAGSNMIDLSTAQLKNKKTQENEKSKNVKDGAVPNADETDEALEDPFLDNELLVHCKFSTPIDLSSMNIKSLTPIYYSDTPSNPFAETNGDTDAAQTLKRTGRMKSKDLTGPILLTNSSEIALINNCSMFVRPKVNRGSQGNVSESEVSMDTQERDKALDILSPRSLDVILQNPPTLDAYLDTCNDIEGFNTSDAQICTLIWKAASEMKDVGAAMTSLKQMFHDKTSLLEEASFSLEQHFKKLCNAKLLLQVGIFEKRYVCPSFARSWCINFSKRKIVIPEESNEDNSLQPDGTLPASSASESLATSAPTEPDPSATTEVETKTPPSITASPHSVAAAILSEAVQAETYEPVSTQPVSSATTPSTSLKAGTSEVVATQPVAAAATPSTSLQAGTSEAVITQPLSSAAVSSESIQAGTSEAVNKQPLAAAPTASASMQAGTSEPLTTQPVSSVATSSESIQAGTSEAVNKQPVAPASTAPTTVQAGTSEPLTTQPVSSAATLSASMMAGTSEAVTSLPLSTAVVPSVAPVPTIMSKSSLCVSTESTLNSTEATSPSGEMTMDDVNSLDMKLSESPSTDLTRVVQGSSEENTDTSDKITSETSKRLPDESEAIISRPWLELNGSLNKVFLKSLLHAIMSEIISNPGITEIHIAQKFVNLIRPVYFAELLEYLESTGCITKHTLAMSKPTSLFSTTTEKKDEKKFIYYLPVVDCIVTLANAVQNWS